jgi:hypothetical protein
MPIKARIDMLSTGIRTPIGVKVYGPDLAGIDRLSRVIEALCQLVIGTPLTVKAWDSQKGCSPTKPNTTTSPWALPLSFSTGPIAQAS